MPFNPDAQIDAPTIGGFSVETDSLTLWQKWLAELFTGETHTIDGIPVVIPKCALGMQEGDFLKPDGLDQNSITVLWGTKAKTLRREHGSGIWHGHVDAIWNFHVRCTGSIGGKDPKQWVREIGDVLYGCLLRRTCTRKLALKGIHHVGCGNPIIRTGTQFAQRDLVVNAELIFPLSAG